MTTHLLLDLDGTLVDSSPGIYHSFVVACDKLSLPPPSYASFFPLIGPPIQEISTQLFPGLDRNTIDRLRMLFRHDYDNLSYQMCEWYPSVLDTIDCLSASSDLSLSIVTNKPTNPALNIINSAGVGSCFSRIVGIDYLAVCSSGPLFSSKSDALSYVLMSDSVDLLKSVYVGDTLSDMDACKRCNLPFVAALYGFHRWHDDQISGPCIKHFGEIEGLLP